MSRHVLLEFMAKPMAAPETPELRRLRWAWVALCASLCVGVAMISFWVAIFGQWVSAAVFVLAIVTVWIGWIYFTTKNRADEAWNAKEPEA